MAGSSVSIAGIWVGGRGSLLFESQSDADYERVFQIFDTDHGGGIDPFEFRSLAALLGDHSTEAEAREMFLEYDRDGDGRHGLCSDVTGQLGVVVC